MCLQQIVTNLVTQLFIFIVRRLTLYKLLGLYDDIVDDDGC